MRALVHLRGGVGDVDLWPYAARVQVLGEDSLLTLEVGDSLELVGALSALTQRGLQITRVDTIERDEGLPDA